MCSLSHTAQEHQTSMVLATVPLKSHDHGEADAGVEDDVVEGVEDLREHVGVDLGVNVQGPLEHPGQAEVQHSDRREQDVAESGIISIIRSSRTIRDNLALKRLFYLTAKNINKWLKEFLISFVDKTRMEMKFPMFPKQPMMTCEKIN